MVEQVHEHGALAGIELYHGGAYAANNFSRLPPIGRAAVPAGQLSEPMQAQAMDKADIREFRRWHREAAIRSMEAGYDIVYVYACHEYLLAQFLDPANDRSDEYGGSHENRLRLIHEVLLDTKEAVGHTCAVAIRFSAGAGGDSERDVEEAQASIEILKDIPDLWDVTLEDYSFEMGTSRFVKEASLQSTVSYVKQITQKPVVSVGRFTTPDTMLRMIKENVVDLIGCARPSIADPFLPTKINEGREDEIRECIGCNICYTGDQTYNPIRCTQNPTMGEEWRRGWHPEQIAAKRSNNSVLIVGAGPAGLEAAVSLGRRGYDVALAEGTRELGGRVLRESSLPGLAEWSRVVDYRLGQLEKLPNVEIYRESLLDKEQILEFGSDHVVLATGSTWRRTGEGHWHTSPIEGLETARLYTPDDLMTGKLPQGPVLLFDDEHYYMGGLLAEKLRALDIAVTLITPEAKASLYTENTEEHPRIQAHLIEIGVELELNTGLDSLSDGWASLVCAYTEQSREVEAHEIVLVTSREPNDELYEALSSQISITRIGDCLAPGTIAAAVYSGHRFAREFDEPTPKGAPFKRERVGPC
jgi:dimethylamine/trimethylamine dehydrogenase